MSSNFSKMIAAALIGTSPASVQFLIDQEGMSNHVYRDSVGYPTVCVGVMDRNLVVGKYYSDQECVTLTAKQLHKFITALDRVVKVPINDDMRTALISLIYNIGIGAFENSTLLRKLNAGDYVGAANQFTVWVYGGQGAKKVVIQGLLNRRLREQSLFRRGVVKLQVLKNPTQ